MASIAELKADLRSRGVPDAKIAACSERKDLEALLAASRTHKAGDRCWVQGVTDSAEMDGHEVIVISETPVFELLRCKLVSGREIRVRPCNLQRRDTCSHCNAPCDALKNCAKCGVSSYCGKACQVGHWKVHKRACGREVSAKPQANMADILQTREGQTYMQLNDKLGALMQANDFAGIAALEGEIRDFTKHPSPALIDFAGVMLHQLGVALKALGRPGAKQLEEHPMVKRALRKVAAGEGPLASAQHIAVEVASGNPRVKRLGQAMNDLLKAEDFEGFTRLDSKIRELARDPTLTEDDSKLVGVALHNLGTCYEKLGRSELADELKDHPLAQFGMRQHMEYIAGPILDSPEDQALSNKLNELTSCRDYGGVVQLESELLRLARGLERDWLHTAGTIVGNLVNAHEHLGNDARARELRERYGSAIRAALVNHEEIRGKERKVLDEFQRRYEQEDWRGAADMTESVLLMLGPVQTERPQEAHAFEIQLIMALRNAGDHRECIKLAESLRVKARKRGDKESQIMFLNTIANAYRGLEQMDEAVRYYEMDRVLSAEIGDRAGVSETLGMLAHCQCAKGDPQKAIATYQEAIQIAQELGDIDAECTHLGNMASSYYTWSQMPGSWPQTKAEMISVCERAFVRCLELADESLRNGTDGEGRNKVIEVKAKALNDLCTLDMNQIMLNDQGVMTRTQFAAQQHLPEIQEKLARCQHRLRESIDICGEARTDAQMSVLHLSFVLHLQNREEDAVDQLRVYLDAMVEQSRGANKRCGYCGRLFGDSAPMLQCGNCRVTRFCNEEHQKKAWGKSRRGAGQYDTHKRLCPLLKHVRQMRKAGDAEAFRVQALEFMNNAIFGDGADEQAEKIRFFLAMSEDEQAELLGDVSEDERGGALAYAQAESHREAVRYLHLGLEKLQKSQPEQIERGIANFGKALSLAKNRVAWTIGNNTLKDGFKAVVLRNRSFGQGKLGLWEEALSSITQFFEEYESVCPDSRKILDENRPQTLTFQGQTVFGRPDQTFEQEAHGWKQICHDEAARVYMDKAIQHGRQFDTDQVAADAERSVEAFDKAMSLVASSGLKSSLFFNRSVVKGKLGRWQEAQSDLTSFFELAESMDPTQRAESMDRPAGPSSLSLPQEELESWKTLCLRMSRQSEQVQREYTQTKLRQEAETLRTNALQSPAGVAPANAASSAASRGEKKERKKERGQSSSAAAASSSAAGADGQVAALDGVRYGGKFGVDAKGVSAPDTPAATAAGARDDDAEPNGGKKDEPPVVFESFEVGDAVSVTGLQSKPQHNGKVGSIIGRQGGRFQVLLQDDSKTSVALKPANLEPEFLFESSKPFIEMYHRLATCNSQHEEDPQPSMLEDTVEMLSNEAQMLRVARQMAGASDDHAACFVRNLKQTAGDELFHNLVAAFHLDPEGFEDGQLCRAHAQQIYNFVADLLVDYPPGIGQKRRACELFEKSAAVSQLVSAKIEAAICLKLATFLVLEVHDYTAALPRILRVRTLVAEFPAAGDDGTRPFYYSELASLCLEAYQLQQDQVLGKIAARDRISNEELQRKLLETGIELTAGIDDASPFRVCARRTRGWCFAGLGFLNPIGQGTGSDEVLAKSIAYFDEALAILQPLELTEEDHQRVGSIMGLQASMMHDLALRAGKAGDRGDLPQKQHTAAVRLMGEATEIGFKRMSEAAKSGRVDDVGHAAKQVFLSLPDYVSWYFLGTDEVVKFEEMPYTKCGNYTLLAKRQEASCELVPAEYTAKPGEEVLALLQQALTRIEKFQEEVAKSTKKADKRGLKKICASLLAGFKAIGGRQFQVLESGAALTSSEREAIKVQELGDLLLALDGEARGGAP